jgi:hypothetical protein
MLKPRIVFALFAGLVVGARWLPMTALSAAADACSLLTVSEVSAALEVNSLPGTRPLGSPKACMWSDVPKPGAENRRVTLGISSSTAGYDTMKSRRLLPIEPVTGIGDDAFYQSFGTHESPMLRVKKGNGVFDVRILNGLKSKPFTPEQEKAKEAALAKAAAARFS